MNWSEVIEKMNSVTLRVREALAKRLENPSHYRLSRESGLSPVDSLFSALYINACESNEKLCALLERVAKPLSCVSKTALGKIRKEKVGLFSDSSLMIVSRSLAFIKKQFVPVAAVALAVVLSMAVISDNSQKAVLELYVNGVSVGTVDSAKTVDAALARVEQRVTDITGRCYDLPCTLSYSVKSSTESTLGEQELYELFNAYSADETCNAYGLYIDNKEVAVVGYREDITFVISTLEAQHLALTGENAHIANRLDIRYGEYASDSLISRAQLKDLLSGVEPENKESDERILAQADTAVLQTASDVDAITENITQTLSATPSSAVVISYETVSLETKREYVDYQIRYIEDSSLFKGQSRISTYGHKGLSDVTYAVSYVDGEEVGRTVNSTSVVYEPVNQVVRIGTRDYPETLSEEATGGKYMIRPVVNSRITDRYGARNLNGRNDYHYGLDYAANYGTSIYAAASGKVIYAAYNSSYGYCVKIEHEDGLISLYAHCSKLLVKEGDTVVQGDLIAQVGNTGYSYGNHCHFEVIEDGHKVDPELYIYEN